MHRLGWCEKKSAMRQPSCFSKKFFFFFRKFFDEFSVFSFSSTSKETRRKTFDRSFSRRNMLSFFAFFHQKTEQTLYHPLRAFRFGRRERKRERTSSRPLFAPLEGEESNALSTLPPLLSLRSREGGKNGLRTQKNPRRTWMWLTGLGLSACTMSGNFIPSRTKNTGMLLPDQVPVALARVELDREAARVADRLGRAALVDDGREARDDGRLHPRRAEEVGAGQVRDVVRRLEEALGRGAAGVDDALRDALAVELSIFFLGVGVGGRRGGRVGVSE